MLLTPTAPQGELHRRARARQEGVVLMMALIVLIALTLAGLALTRSVYTSNVIAGNLAFQQSATHSADTGVETAVAWLEGNNGQASSLTAVPCESGSVLDCDQKDRGYRAIREDPTAGQSWGNFWKENIEKDNLAMDLPIDTKTGNQVSYFIQRMCTKSGSSQSLSNNCTTSPVDAAGTCAGGSSCLSGKENLAATSQIYFRITVRVIGPRNTQSFVQSIVAL
ncbi:MAG: hypothetical protein HY019_11080 [Aquabacterium sp.]|uniref:pilus assembly PilX family protein n=1 Tax=Aquabacterium sp. TaxID=1872578 RepID=UPI0025BB5C5E|nr:hypothetical protein [Aquabacterium sp.]MBI3382538.1 hypothetical protein [Aquabacterium sp.]